MIPKVKFYLPNLNYILPTIYNFLKKRKGHFDWSNIILCKYPELDEKLKKCKTKKDKDQIVQDFFENLLKKDEKKFKKNLVSFQESWDKINDEFMKALEEVLEIKWPKKDKRIISVLTPNPICPRHIEGRTFDINYEFSLDLMKKITMHEILHFLWFEKWKQIFPNANEKEFNSPHLVWKLSEIVPKAILSDKKIQEIFKHRPEVYEEYQFFKINGKPLTSHIGKFYYEKKDFEDFVKKSWAFVKKHKKEINKI